MGFVFCFLVIGIVAASLLLIDDQQTSGLEKILRKKRSKLGK